jgi:cytochrome P450
MARQTVLRPAGPPEEPFWGHLWAFRRDPLAFLNNLTTYGDIVFFYLGPQPMYLVNHPDLIKEVLVNQASKFIRSRAIQRSKHILGDGVLTLDGDAHRRQRRMLQPAFHHQRIAGYGKIMIDQALRCRAQWQSGQVVDISQEMTTITLKIVAKALFDTDINNDADDIAVAMNEFVQSFKYITLPFSEVLNKLPLPHVRRMKRACAFIDQSIERFIAEHRQSGQDHGDLLSMLLITQDEEELGRRLSNKQIRDEVLAMFLAGHETTATAITWTWYLLAQHPVITAKVYAEIDSVLQGQTPTPADYSRLPYLEMVFSEAMRLYPPAWMLARRVNTECELGGYRLPRMNAVILSPYLIHRDARYYSQPEEFYPERWAAGRYEGRPRFAYFPFGGGTQQCIGEHFAWMEGILVLATLLQQWQLQLEPNQQIWPRPMITLRPNTTIKMRLTRRDELLTRQ